MTTMLRPTVDTVQDFLARLDGVRKEGAAGPPSAQRMTTVVSRSPYPKATASSSWFTATRAARSSKS